MKSKIKKFRFGKDPMIKTRDEFLIENKLNEIIDHLNSQDQLREIEEVTVEITDIIEKIKSYLNSQDQ